MDEAVSGWIKKRLLSAFPQGTFAHVEVLEYGDDPAVEPGDTAVRAFIDRAGRPAENWDSRDTVDDFATANSEGIGKLHDGLLPSIAWVDFVPDTPESRAKPYDQTLSGTRFMGKRPDVLEGVPGGARVGTWLMPEDLATVDALITAGIAASRAEAMRWALGRIRENPIHPALGADARGQRTQGTVLVIDAAGLAHRTSTRPAPGSSDQCGQEGAQVGDHNGLQGPDVCENDSGHSSLSSTEPRTTCRTASLPPVTKPRSTI